MINIEVYYCKKESSLLQEISSLLGKERISLDRISVNGIFFFGGGSYLRIFCSKEDVDSGLLRKILEILKNNNRTNTFISVVVETQVPTSVDIPDDFEKQLLSSKFPLATRTIGGGVPLSLLENKSK